MPIDSVLTQVEDRRDLLCSFAFRNQLEDLFPQDRARTLASIARDGGQKELTLGKALLLGTSWDGTFQASGNNNDMGDMKRYLAGQSVKKAGRGIMKLFTKNKK